MCVGVVFDSGDSMSHSVPVFDGYCLPHAVQRFNLAGADVTLHLKQVCAHTHTHTPPFPQLLGVLHLFKLVDTRVSFRSS